MSKRESVCQKITKKEITNYQHFLDILIQHTKFLDEYIVSFIHDSTINAINLKLNVNEIAPLITCGVSVLVSINIDISNKNNTSYYSTNIKLDDLLRVLFKPYENISISNEEFIKYLLKTSQLHDFFRDIASQLNNDEVPPYVLNHNFYEEFISKYCPSERNQKGMYYTPPSVVKFIINGLSSLVKHHSQPPNDINNYEDFLYIDPSVGSGIFLTHLLNSTEKKHVINQNLADVFFKVVESIRAFDISAVAALICSLSIIYQIYQHSAVSLFSHMKESQSQLIDLFNRIRNENIISSSRISDEIIQELKIKNKIPIILGNPPYKGHSENTSDFITRLIADYTMLDNTPLIISQGKWLQNDYIKFLRWTEYIIDRVGVGFFGFILDNSFLDGDTFIGVRYHLVKTFDSLYILNLRGNNRRSKITSTDLHQNDDENIFNIEQGNCIILGSKKQIKSSVDSQNYRKSSSSKKISQVFFYDLIGSKTFKLETLEQFSFKDLLSLHWSPLSLESPKYLFIPELESSKDLKDHYLSFPSIPEIFSCILPSSRPAPGFLTLHDDFAIGFSKEDITKKMEKFINCKEEKEARGIFKLSTQKKEQQWDFQQTMSYLKKGDWKDSIVKCLYRPFDYRYTIYNPNILVHRRERVNSQFMDPSFENIGLLTTRMTKGDSYKHSFVTNLITEVICLSSKTSSNAFIFPLYIKKIPKSKEMESRFECSLHKNIIKNVEKLTSLRYNEGKNFIERHDANGIFGPYDFFAYIYAILNSSHYRKQYNSFLMVDFPRIPYPNNIDQFKRLVNIGNSLINLHLMKGIPPNILNISFETVQTGKQEILRVALLIDDADPKEKVGKLWINDHSFFFPVSESVWNYQIGSYQVLKKWILNRRQKQLTPIDIQYVINLILVLNECVRIKEDLEKIYLAIDDHGDI